MQHIYNQDIVNVNFMMESGVGSWYDHDGCTCNISSVQLAPSQIPTKNQLVEIHTIDSDGVIRNMHNEVVGEYKPYTPYTEATIPEHLKHDFDNISNPETKALILDGLNNVMEKRYNNQHNAPIKTVRVLKRTFNFNRIDGSLSVDVYVTDTI